MSTPKIRTTVYSHKVIDVVKFHWDDNTEVDALYELMEQLAETLSFSRSGPVHIKVDRPHSDAEKQHRLGVVAKNDEKRKGARWYPERREREEYERLKRKFES